VQFAEAVPANPASMQAATKSARISATHLPTALRNWHTTTTPLAVKLMAKCSVLGI
jgi:hypothetical protein